MAVCCTYVGQKGCRKSIGDAWFIDKRWRRSSEFSKPWITNDDKRLDTNFDNVSFCFWVGFCNALAFIARSKHSGVLAGQKCFQNSVLKHHHIIHIPKKTRKLSSHLQIYTFIFAQLDIITKSLFAIRLFIEMIINQWINLNFKFRRINIFSEQRDTKVSSFPMFCFDRLILIAECRSMLSTSYQKKPIPSIFQIKAKHKNLKYLGKSIHMNATKCDGLKWLIYFSLLFLVCVWAKAESHGILNSKPQLNLKSN